VGEDLLDRRPLQDRRDDLQLAGVGQRRRSVSNTRLSSRAQPMCCARAWRSRRGAVLAAFLGESLLRALVGSVVGPGATTLMQTVNLSTVNFQTLSELAFQFRMTGTIELRAPGVALAMGFVGGFVPAGRAARLKIVDCLRAT